MLTAVKRAVSDKRITALILMALSLFAIIAFSVTAVNAEDYYEIRIEYMNSDDSARIHDPYVAMFPRGAEVNVTVTNPVIPGYKPSTAIENGESALSTSLNYTDLSQSHEIKIYYLPDLVHYKVRFFKQNIRDDRYTEDLSLDQSEYERTGLTGEYPEELEKKTFEGFTSLFHEPDVIAADGSTIFKVYYDRNYYLINFDLDHGYGVEPVYGKYQSRYNIAEPTRKGYTFEGWALSDGYGNFIDEDGNKIDREDTTPTKFTSGVVPSRNVNYKAVWKPAKTKYSIIYWIENANDDGYSVAAAKDIRDVTSDSVITLDYVEQNMDFFKKPDGTDRNLGSDFPSISSGEIKELKGKGRYFETDREKSDESITVDGDGTSRINIYYRRKPITQRFFYAKKTGKPDASGKIYLSGYTKAFSSKDGTLDDHLTSSWGGSTSWMEVSDTLPVISDKYSDKIVQRSYYSEKNNATYYYYQVKTKYYANMREHWLLDALEPVQITKNKESGVPDPDYARFGAWSVEWGTPYAKKANKTVKGIYEKLDEQLLYTEDYLKKSYVDVSNGDDLVLNYLSFWTNVKNAKWNKKASIYNFTYKNYTELLPSEYDENGNWNGTGGYIDTIKNESDGVIYGLLEKNVVQTYDGGDQYANVSTRDGKVKENQTAAALTGFELVSDAYASESGLGKNPRCSWCSRDEDGDGVDDFNADHHCDISYFYRRLHYSIKYRNNNELDPTKTCVYYQQSLSGNYSGEGKKTNGETYQMVNEPFDYTPVYPDEDIAKYYSFAGWYRDPKHIEAVDFENSVMPADDETFYAKWVPVKEGVRFYNDYNKLQNDEPLYECRVDYDSLMLEHDIPTSNPDDTTSRAKLVKPYVNATFAGWYYFKDGVAIRFDPESMPVTRELRLYAEWVSNDTANYKLRFVEKNDHSVDVASPITGTAFISKTKTFQAKGGSELNESHKWEDGSVNWWPTFRSTSILVEPNDNNGSYSPNEKVLEYVKKDKVWYRVRYLDSATNQPLKPELKGQISSATVTAKAPYIEGYIADRVTKTIVLSASADEDVAAAQAQEISENTVIFYYTKNDKEALYQVNYLRQELDSDDPADRSAYSLYMNETLTIALGAPVNFEALQEQDHAQALVNAGFSFVPELTTIEGEVEVVEHSDDSQVSTDGKTMIINLYYKRNAYNYSYNLVDYEQEARYKAEMNKPEEERDSAVIKAGDGLLETVTDESFREFVGKTVPVYPSTEIEVNGVKYSRVSSRELSIVIRPDEALNTINVYYIKQGRYTIRFKPYCVIATEDNFAAVSMNQKIVRTVEDLEGSTAIELMPDQYTFKGWYENPDMSHEAVGTELFYKPENLPTTDITYYAVFEPKYLDPRVRYEYSDDDGETWIRPDGTPEKPVRSCLSAAFADTADVTELGNAVFTKHIAYNSDIVFTASAKECGHYHFDGWYDADGNLLSDEETHTFTVRDNVDYIARFKKEMVKVDVDIICNDSGEYEPVATRSIQSKPDTSALTGYNVEFSSPEAYSVSNLVPYDDESKFRFRLEKTEDNDGRLYKYVFSKWYKVVSNTKSAKPIELSEGLEDYVEAPRTQSVKYVAVFKKADSVDYRLNFKFLPRSASAPEDIKTFVKKGTLEGEDFEKYTKPDTESIELTDEFVMLNAPFESNYGETLVWNSKDIRLSYKDGRVVADIVARQSKKQVFINYRTDPDSVYVPLKVNLGDNRELNPEMLDINADPEYMGQRFSYWAIKKSEAEDAEVIAKCHSAEFDFCVMDDYWVDPVYEDVPETKSAVNEIKLTHLDYTRNQWTDDEGELSQSGSTDLLYTDFEIAFADDFSKIYNSSSHKIGVVFELCAKKPDNVSFDPTKDYGAVTDTDNLKDAIKDKATNYYYKSGKRRSIQSVEIPIEYLTNKNRVEFGKAYKNAYTESDGKKTYTNSTYLMKVWGYLIDENNEVTLSNPIYICLSDIAAKNLAKDNGTVE